MLENVLDKCHSFLLYAESRMAIFRGFCRSGRKLRAAGAGVWAHAWAGILAVGVGVAMLAGCSHLGPQATPEYVYVTAQQTFLRDRVAAVSNRTGTVQNGERLVVLEHGRKFFRVRSPENAEGWIDQKAVATQQVYDAFQALRVAHQGDPAVASAVVRDVANLHLKPGRETERFYQLAEGDKVQLLERATLPKPVVPSAAPMTAPKSAVAAAGKGAKGKEAAGMEVAPTIAMEDWWLARDAQGRTGWLLSRYLDVDAPDSLTRYAEGQKIVGAYVLTTVNDPDAAPDSGASKDGNVPIYLTVMGPYTAGLPYDFDQVRVFTWSMKMHRYETAFRDKNIEGYLPVTVRTATDPYGKSAAGQTPEPTFTYKVLAADAGPVVPNPVTGMVTPGRTLERTYRLEGNLVRRVAPPGIKDEVEAHPVVEEKREKVGKGKKR
jgi:SH3-like domain-containing protein